MPPTIDLPPRTLAHAHVLATFDSICKAAGLTGVETIILAAYFAGMAVAAEPVTGAHQAQLTVAAGAMQDAYRTKMTRRGLNITEGRK